MKKLLLFILLLGYGHVPAQGQFNYVAAGDSCFKIKDFNCAATNYDLFLEKIEPRSNMIAYRAALAWCSAKNTDKTFAALARYVHNNYENKVIRFSKELLGEPIFSVLHQDRRWVEMIDQVRKREKTLEEQEKKIVETNRARQDRLQAESMFKKLDFSEDDALATYKKISDYNFYPAIKYRYLSMSLALTDSLSTTSLICLPQNYDPLRAYPLLFSLHGAVKINTSFPMWMDSTHTGSWNRHYTKYAAQQGVIMVYPTGNKDYNWMHPDRGFFMIPKILRQIKQTINIDDDRIFITGHSNGATGSFSYLMKQPSPFAGFYGFNTRPIVATGGTYIRNILNRSFFNVSTDNDYYYPPEANDSLTAVMKKLGADYQDHRYEGFPHWFPQFDESDQAHQLLFRNLSNRHRKPFQSNIYWECDNTIYGRCDWLSITALDTLARSASWHKEINFKITKWKLYDSKRNLVTRDTLIDAYQYRNKSGAAKAEYKNNVFRVSTSRVGTIRIFISPKMVDLNKPVIIYVNGKKKFKDRIPYDKATIIHEFEDSADRKAVWVNYVDVDI